MNYDNTRPVHYRSTVVIKANSPIKRLLLVGVMLYLSIGLKLPYSIFAIPLGLPSIEQLPTICRSGFETWLPFSASVAWIHWLSL